MGFLCCSRMPTVNTSYGPIWREAWGTKPISPFVAPPLGQPKNLHDITTATDFSDIFLFSYKQRTFVPFLANFLAHNMKMTGKSVFCETDVTIIPSLLFLVSQFCTSPEVNFHVFFTSKHEEKSLLHSGDFIEQIETNLSHTR